MLRRLTIKNFTLIDKLDITFEGGFSVITGETGAGKSIILGAIGLLLGQRADTKSIKRGADKCVIEAHFDISRYQLEDFFHKAELDFEPDDTIIRRELLASGKSRAFINDTPASVAQLKELGEMLIDVHSQHQNLLLSKHDFQLGVLDVVADAQQALADYQHSFADFQRTRDEYQAMQAEIAENSRSLDFMQFQLTELSDAHLEAGEQEELEQRAETMSHAEDIKRALYTAADAIDNDEVGVLVRLKTAQSAVGSVRDLMPKGEETAERLDSCLIELRDISDELAAMLDATDFDPAEMDAVNQRLDLIYSLEKKHRTDSVEELIAIRDSLAEKVNQINTSDELLQELAERMHREETLCREKAAALTARRQEAARKIEHYIPEGLVPLGMPHVKFEVRLTSTDLGRQGQDRVDFYFSANTSTELQPIATVASGGEIARVMLTLKAIISKAVKLPTIIFDEIDTGVSGKIAEQMAAIMTQMGNDDRQVISITHLPQIAAKGRHHYKVEKQERAEGTVSIMRRLDNDERVAEIAQMLSGSDVTAAAVENAKALLDIK